MKKLFFRELIPEQRTQIQVAPAAAPSPHSIFKVIYGSEPSQDERQRLAFLGIPDADMTASNVRKTIGSCDRQARPTPYIVRFSSEDVAYARFENFALAIDSADDSVSRAIRDTAVYEPHMTAVFRRMIKPGMHVVDVGANIGYFTILSTSLVGSGGRVSAFEPNSENCRLILISQTRNNIGNLKLYPVALSTKAGVAYFTSFLGSNGGLLPDELYVLYSPQCTVVPTFRMDQIVTERIDFLKVDVEGAEGMVLEGGWSLIERYRPIVSSELSPEMLRRVSGVDALDYIKRFTALGYRVHHVDRDDLTGEGTPIPDVDAFMASYGHVTRIEDLLFMP